jgi:hypothetical protein
MGLVTELRSDTYEISLLGATVTSPGICEIVGASDGRKWDEQAGFGLSGAALVGGGQKLAHFAIKHTIWEQPSDPFPAQWMDWQMFKPFVSKPIPGVRAPSLGIDHPILADLGISAVVVEDRTQWMQDANGLWTMQIKYIQYRAAQIMSVKAGPGVPPGPAPPTAAQTEDSDKLARARYLNAQAKANLAP